MSRGGCSRPESSWNEAADPDKPRATPTSGDTA
eukprot:gene26507-biopygen16698